MAAKPYTHPAVARAQAALDAARLHTADVVETDDNALIDAALAHEAALVEALHVAQTRHRDFRYDGR